MPVPPKPFDFNSVTRFCWIAKPKEGEFGRGHPVYLLTTASDAQYVVKMEQTVGPDVKTASRTMDLLYDLANQVGGGVAGRSLEFSEVTAFFAMVRRLAGTLDQETKDHMRMMEGIDLGLRNEKKRTTWLPGYTQEKVDQAADMWIIMDAQKGLDDLKGMMKSPDASKILRTLTDLQKDYNLAALGRILAVDMFVGNNDRFNFQRGTIQNFGNVFFVNQDGAFSIRGLDPVDPGGQNKFNEELFKQEQNIRQDWQGAKLNDDEHLKWVASMALDAVVAALKPKLHKYQQLRFAFSFGATEKLKVYLGIKEGVERIRAICVLMMKSPRRPAGLQSRMAALGWLDISMFGRYGSSPDIEQPRLPTPGGRIVIGSGKYRGPLIPHR